MQIIVSKGVTKEKTVPPSSHRLPNKLIIMNIKPRACELCNQQASLYCPSDSAFLCWNCDATVHGANFLVARHLRHLLCCKCNRFAGNHISGGTSLRVASTCRSCSPENRSCFEDGGDSLSSSSCSSACVSSSESCATAPNPKKIKVRTGKVEKMRSSTSSVTDGDASTAVEQKRRRRRADVGGAGAEEVFVNWSRELGVNGNCAASLASQALGLCLQGKWTRANVLPFRVALATSFWLGLRFCGDKSVATFRNLTRLEAISGVPAKLILAAQAKLARAFTHRRQLQLEEGWAES